MVGLGNPGRRYEGTRHNIGYAVLWPSWPGKFGSGPPKAQFHGAVVEAKLSDQKALLLSPTTFMNLSGTSVQEARVFTSWPTRRSAGHLRRSELAGGQAAASGGGSSGGQKGLEDIIRRLATEEFSRLRIGVGTAPDGWAWADYVLSRFTAEEFPWSSTPSALAAEAVAAWAREGIESCMNRYNSNGA